MTKFGQPIMPPKPAAPQKLFSSYDEDELRKAMTAPTRGPRLASAADDKRCGFKPGSIPEIIKEAMLKHGGMTMARITEVTGKPKGGVTSALYRYEGKEFRVIGKAKQGAIGGAQNVWGLIE